MRKIADIRADIQAVQSDHLIGANSRTARLANDADEMIKILLNVQATLEAMNDKYILSLLDPDIPTPESGD